MDKATLSISTNAFPTDELFPCLEWVAQKLKLKGVEIGPWHAELLYDNPDEILKLKEALTELGLQAFSLHSFGKKVQYDLDVVCPFAQELGAGLIVKHCRHDDLVEDFEGQVSFMQKWTDWCKERGIIMSVENSAYQPLEPFVELFKSIPDLMMTMDVKHACKPETLGLTHKDYMPLLGDRAANFHISGIDRARKELGDGTPPGNDLLDWDDYAEDLVQRNYKGLITIELIFPRYMSVEEQEEAYYDLPPATPDCSSISQRLSLFGVEFYRNKLAPVLT